MAHVEPLFLWSDRWLAPAPGKTQCECLQMSCYQSEGIAFNPGAVDEFIIRILVKNVWQQAGQIVDKVLKK